MTAFKARYGPWALVAGASQGIGAAFATELAARGLNVALVARGAERLQRLGDELQHTMGVEALTISQDLSDPDSAQAIAAQLEGREVNLLVYNAALSLVGPFLEQSFGAHLRELDTNVRAPLSLTYEFGRRMAQRRRGGIILMSSLAAFQGGPFIANYTATKAYNLVLAEGLWAELGERGVDVLACLAGATATQGFTETAPTRTSRFAPPPLAPRAVATEALDALGKAPSIVPGWSNRLASQVMRRLLSRRAAIRLMERNTRSLTRTQAGP